MEAQVEKYKKLRPIYEDFNERIKDLLKSLIEENKIKYHLIETRTKSLESFKEKIERKSNKYSNPIEEITDLAGIRIIVYYQDDVARIEEIIKNEFIVDDQNSFDKGKLLKTNEFGYQSVHYVVSLSFDRAKLSEWKKYSKFKIEIQIRTVLQHSWASISHELEYKKSYEIPTILQRRLFRLASLIELDDEEFKKSKDQHN
jgi:ppGpp synthetase/RelA/SpoT-type nucleotidyltranferase